MNFNFLHLHHFRTFSKLLITNSFNKIIFHLNYFKELHWSSHTCSPKNHTISSNKNEFFPFQTFNFHIKTLNKIFRKCVFTLTNKIFSRLHKLKFSQTFSTHVRSRKKLFSRIFRSLDSLSKRTFSCFSSNNT